MFTCKCFCLMFSYILLVYFALNYTCVIISHRPVSVTRKVYLNWLHSFDLWPISCWCVQCQYRERYIVFTNSLVHIELTVTDLSVYWANATRLLSAYSASISDHIALAAPDPSAVRIYMRIYMYTVHPWTTISVLAETCLYQSPLTISKQITTTIWWPHIVVG